jgi:hypothetical protein
MDRLPIDRARQEFDQGIASVTAALADGTAPAPFMRIPGLRRNDGIEEYAASKGLQIWSADFPADDWRNVSAGRVYDLAIQRLEAKRKGILLLHDIQPRTVAALPRILSELKARGYRIVHVVPATPERLATPTEPQQWQVHPASETVATSRWPKIPKFAFAATATLSIPAFSDSGWRNTVLAGIAPRRARVATPWPQPTVLPPAGALAALTVPAQSVFRMPESARVTMLASFAHHGDQTAHGLRATEVSARLTGKSRHIRTSTRSVRIANLKKR